MYPVPPSAALAGSVCSLLPTGARWAVPCAVVGHRYLVCWFSEGWMQGGGERVGGVWVLVVYGGGARLPKKFLAGPVFLLWSMHTDIVCRHP